MLQVDVRDGRLKAVLQQLEQVGENAAQALKPVMRDRMQRVMAAAKQLTPIARGYLRRSGQARADTIGQQVRGQVTFGALAAAYAEVQHESEGFRHTLPAGVSRSHTSRLYRDGRGRLRPRKRKHPIKGYRGGQAHFLHGAPNSAWNKTEELRLLDSMVDAAEVTINEATG